MALTIFLSGKGKTLVSLKCTLVPSIYSLCSSGDMHERVNQESDEMVI